MHKIKIFFGSKLMQRDIDIFVDKFVDEVISVQSTMQLITDSKHEKILVTLVYKPKEESSLWYLKRNGVVIKSALDYDTVMNHCWGLKDLKGLEIWLDDELIEEV